MHFYSDKIHCKWCCIKNHKDRTKVWAKYYYYQTLGPTNVHPNQKEAVPLVPEPIIREEGAIRDGFELNASKRLLLCGSHNHG
jgi:hypothetical protein